MTTEFIQKIENARERDMIIMSNLSDAQELIRFGKDPEALQVLNDLKKFMMDTKKLLPKS